MESDSVTISVAPAVVEPSEQFLSVLLCTRCRSPVVRSDGVLPHRASDIWAEQVFAYEFEMFSEKPPVWCYSATNPLARRFDLVRCVADISRGAPLVRLHGDYCSEHSFFVGHAWCYCECGACGNFLGWGFRKLGDENNNNNNENNENENENGNNENENENGNENKENVNENKENEKKRKVVVRGEDVDANFIGLIVTQCVGENCFSPQKYEQRLQEAAQLQQVVLETQQQTQRFFCIINKLHDRTAANALLRLYEGYRTSPTLRVARQTLLSVEALVGRAEEALREERENKKEKEEEEGEGENNEGEEQRQLLV